MGSESQKERKLHSTCSLPNRCSARAELVWSQKLGVSSTFSMWDTRTWPISKALFSQSHLQDAELGVERPVLKPEPTRDANTVRGQWLCHLSHNTGHPNSVLTVIIRSHWVNSEELDMLVNDTQGDYRKVNAEIFNIWNLHSEGDWQGAEVPKASASRE